MAEAATAPDPHAAELDRLLDDLIGDAHVAEGLTMCAELVGETWMDGSGSISTASKDALCLRFLLTEAEKAALRVRKGIEKVEKHLGAGGERPGGVLYQADPEALSHG